MSDSESSEELVSLTSRIGDLDGSVQYRIRVINRGLETYKFGVWLYLKYLVRT